MTAPEIDMDNLPDRTFALSNDCIRRDLEILLNTPQITLDWQEYDDLNISLLSYGVPDIYTTPLATDTQRSDFCDIIAGIISKFEPRLLLLQVTMQEGGNNRRDLCFRIKAAMRQEIGDSIIVYSSTLDPVLRNFLVGQISGDHYE